MGRPALILAALAADATPGKNFRGMKRIDLGPSIDAIQLQDQTGETFVFKMAATATGEQEVAQERAALGALAKAAEHLTFEISKEVGQTRDQNGTVGVLFSQVEGAEPDLSKLAPGVFSRSLAEALASLHSLDLSIVKNAGLPEFDSTTQLHKKVAELDRIASLGKVPAELLSRWEAALEDVGLFRYHPVVVHGGMNSSSLSLAGQQIVGMSGFENLRISDPAEDLAWLVGSALNSTTEDTLLHYRSLRPNTDENILQRATLYSELELGSWLAHCVEQGDEQLIKEAEGLIADLQEQLSSKSLPDLRAASFAGLVAGSAMLPEMTAPIAQVQTEAVEPSFIEEIAADEVVENQDSSNEPFFEEFASNDSIEPGEPSQDELF